MRVVVVEDDRAMQREFERTVSALPGGRIVLTADSAAAAMEWLAQNPRGWDLAIVDIFLRQGHGFDVLRQCRGDASFQRAVMVSNYARSEVASYARSAGADRFFDKSHELEELAGYCRDFCLELAGGRAPRGTP